MRGPVVITLSLTLVSCTPNEAPPNEAPPNEVSRNEASKKPELPGDKLQEIAAQLVVKSGAPGAILGVMRGDKRWIGAGGSEDLAGQVPMRPNGTFRAASITKMFTGVLVLQEVESGALDLEHRLSRWHAEFPEAQDITLDQLISHTAGVTPFWFDGPELQSLLMQDLGRVWSPAEVIALISEQEPFGRPGQSGMQYSNTDFVLLGDVLARQTGHEYADLLRERIIEPLALSATSYGFTNPPGLVSGYYEFLGAPIDMTQVPQQAFLSFAGAAGAIHTTADDLLTFADALFRSDKLVGEDSRRHMMSPAEPESWYAHAMMRFCPCADGPNGTEYSGWGHAGNLPGYWSIVAQYPERDVTVVAMINRDMVNGVMLDHSVFYPTLSAVLDLLK
jgi:D-alanyl-D-alanine carboxypeptidase